MSDADERARLWAELQKAIREDLLLKAQIESLMAQIDQLDAEEESRRRAKALFRPAPDEPEPGDFRPRPSTQPPYDPPASHGEGGDRGDPSST